MLVLFFCVICSFHGSTGVVSTGGREFLVTFQENRVSNGQSPQPQCITLTTVLDTNVSVEIRSLCPDINFSTLITITNTSGEHVCLTNSMQLEGTGVSRKVVRVISQENINVIVNDVEIHSIDSYPAIPVKEFGTEYYVMSYWHESQFSVTASHNETRVDIEFPVRVNPSINYEVKYDGVSFTNPTSMNLLLNYHEVFQLQIMQDLTGVFVSSDKPIAVISGNKKPLIGQMNSFDHLAQQMPPVDTWGRRFVTIPSPQKQTADIYRIITSAPNTVIDIGNNRYSLENEGDWFEVEISSVPVEIRADTAIQVVKLLTNEDGTEPCMMLVVPVEQWHYEYSFRFPGSDGYLLVVIDTSSRTSLLLNSETLDTLQWIEVDNTNISVGYRLLTNNYYTLRSNTADIVFAAYMHQTVRKFAFCSQVGMKLEKINANWNHTKRKSEVCGSITATAITTTSAVTTTAVSTLTPRSSVTEITTTFIDTADTTEDESSTNSITTDGLDELKATVDVTSICNTAGTTEVNSTVDKASSYSGTTEGLKGFTVETENTKTNENCSCQDDFIIISNMSDEDINRIIARLVSNLRIIPNQTSRAMRKKISVPDYRPSATAFGIGGWSMVIIAGLVTCVSDLPHILNHFCGGTKRPRKTSILVSV